MSFSSKPKKIDGVLRHTLRQFGLDKKLLTYQFCLHWSDIVGKELADICQPEAVKQETLLIAVPNSAWVQELSLQSDVILGRLQLHLTEGQVITQIKFVVRDS